MLRNSDGGTVSIFYFTSSESERGCQSALAPETFAFIDEIDIGFKIHHSLERILSRKVDLTINTDRNSLYGLCIYLTQTAERRLQVDLALNLEAYERREIIYILRIAG